MALDSRGFARSGRRPHLRDASAPSSHAAGHPGRNPSVITGPAALIEHQALDNGAAGSSMRLFDLVSVVAGYGPTVHTTTDPGTCPLRSRNPCYGSLAKPCLA
jgi:hypothetical protein